MSKVSDSIRRRYHSTSVAVALTILAFGATPSLADVGPKIGGFVVVKVTFDGKPLKEKDAVGTLLSLSPEFSEHPNHVYWPSDLRWLF